MATPEILIRRARPDEYDEVARLIDVSYAQFDVHMVDAPPERRASYEQYRVSRIDVRSRLADSELFVAERDGRLIGTVTYYPPRADGTGEGWPANWASIRLLAVHPEGRGARIGRLLTEFCLARAREQGATTLGLHTSIIMDVARAMYQRMGFTRMPENDFVLDAEFVVEAYRLDL